MKALRALGILALLATPAFAKAPMKPDAKPAAKPAPAQKGNEMAQLYTTPVKTIDGQEGNLSSYKGKVLLIVNTASQCGYTPQYKGLEALYQKYKARGFEVLGFPSNDFGGQEPGKEEEIKKFCELKYKTTFPMFAKVHVKDGPHKLYELLQKEAGEQVQWNFGKFLVSREGKVRKYYGSKVTPEDAELAKAIEGALGEAK